MRTLIYDFRARNISKAVTQRLGKTWPGIFENPWSRNLLVDLILEILGWEPQSRPKATEVSARIEKICVLEADDEL